MITTSHQVLVTYENARNRSPFKCKICYEIVAFLRRPRAILKFTSDVVDNIGKDWSGCTFRRGTSH